MANTIAAFNPEYWAKALQILHKKQAVYRQIANFRGQAMLKDGDVYHRVLPSSTYVQNYTPGSDLQVQPLNATDDTLLVDKKIATLFSVDDIEKAQSTYDITAQYGKDAVTNVTNNMDADVLFESTNAVSSVDMSDFGGTEGLPVAFDGSNVFDVMSKVMEKLAIENIELNNLFGVISPVEWAVINSQVGARETSFGDTVTKNGFTGNMLRYNGIDQYLSNNYTTSQVLGLASNPTNGDRVAVAFRVPKTSGNPTGIVTIVYNFVSAIGTTPGNVLIGASADATRANLVAAINNPGANNATQVGFTGENLTYLQRRFSATNDDAANRAEIFYKGGDLRVNSDLTVTTDGFIAERATRHLLFGRKNAIDMITQIAPTVRRSDIPLQFGDYIKVLALYGIKTFQDGAEQLVNVKLKFSAPAAPLA